MSHALRGRAVSLSMSTALFAGLLYSLNYVRPITITLGSTDPLPMDPITITTPLIPLTQPIPQSHPTRDKTKEDPIIPFDPPTDHTTTIESTIKTGPIDQVQPTIIGASWIRRPTLDELLDYYPPGPLARGLGGRVMLNCLVGARGDISCAVLSETPAGQGFGRAALAASHLFKMAPQMSDGRPTEGGRIEVPIVFKPPPG